MYASYNLHIVKAIFITIMPLQLQILPGFYLSDPLVPVALDEVSTVNRHRTQESLSAEESQRSPNCDVFSSLESKLHMRNSQSKKRGQGVVEHLSVRPIEFRNGRQNQRNWHALQEVGLAAGFNHERVWGVIGRIVKAVTDVFLVLNTLVDDAVGENKKVGGEGKGPGAGDSCYMKLV